MVAMLDDPDAPTIWRVSGAAPFPDPANPTLPPSIKPRHVTLRDRTTEATVIPFASRDQVPESLLRYLNDQFNKEIEGGNTYPMMEGMPYEKFASYWFQNFGAIMLLGNIASADDIYEGRDWASECLGTFYIKPNYPGRSSHVCNGGFIVTDLSRNRGVGRLMGEAYLDWAPRLGYTYSVFNLVYETNVASCRIWDALGFRRIGRVKGCGNLKSHPGQFVDAIIYGRELSVDDGDGSNGDDSLVSDDRFDRIKFYLKHGRYPDGADRAEKSRLRTAATHYKLLEGDVLTLKGREVISDPVRQAEIARGVHNAAHAGINKTTATIAEKFHWSRIKETVAEVIRNCADCKLAQVQMQVAHLLSAAASANAAAQAATAAMEASLFNSTNSDSTSSSHVAPPAPSLGVKRPISSSAVEPSASLEPASKRASPSPSGESGPPSRVKPGPGSRPGSGPRSGSGSGSVPVTGTGSGNAPIPDSMVAAAPADNAQPATLDSFDISSHDFANPADMPLISPDHSIQLLPPSANIAPHSSMLAHTLHHHHNPSTPVAPESLYQPIDPQIISQPSSHAHHQPIHHNHDHHTYIYPDPDPHTTFDDLLPGPDDEIDLAAMDRDMEMVDYEDENTAGAAMDVDMAGGSGSAPRSRMGSVGGKIFTSQLLAGFSSSGGKGGTGGSGNGGGGLGKEKGGMIVDDFEFGGLGKEKSGMVFSGLGKEKSGMIGDVQFGGGLGKEKTTGVIQDVAFGGGLGKEKSSDIIDDEFDRDG